MNFINAIKQFITQHNLVKQNDTIVIGLSGGPDSVFLLYLLVSLQQEYNLTLIVAHLNHEWRSESDQEELLCKKLAQQHNLSFVSEKLSQLTLAPKFNGSKEEYARKMRRFFLEKIAHEYCATKIALGHHAQDQQETFFIRLIRGASLTGLTAMSAQKNLYIRPLLETNKIDILQWLTENSIAFATDTSNSSPLYLRNRIRSKLLPALHKCDTRFNINFLKSISRLKAAEKFIASEANKTFKLITYKKDDLTIMNVHQLQTIDSTLHAYIIIQWLIEHKAPFTPTEKFLDEIIRFILSPRGGTHALHSSWSLIKKHNEVFIQKI